MASSIPTPAASPLDAPVFRSLQNSITQNQMVEFSRYAQIATVNSDNQPACRTITMRGVTTDPSPSHTHLGVLYFSTDLRSSKLNDFASHPSVELCWFFPITREQYRLRCSVEIVCTKDVASVPTQLTSLVRNDVESQSFHTTAWSKLSSSLRSIFQTPPPGTKKAASGTAVSQQGDLDRYEAQDAEHPSPNFVTVFLTPTRCDYVKLPRPHEDTRGQMQKVEHRESILQPNRMMKRWLHTREENGEWKAVELNP